MFIRKSVFHLNKENINPEDLELEMIDYGLEEIDISDDEIIIFGDYSSYGNINKGLSKLEIKPIKSLLKRIPTNPLEFSDDKLDDIEKILDKLEDDDDVQQVFTNIS